MTYTVICKSDFVYHVKYKLYMILDQYLIVEETCLNHYRL